MKDRECHDARIADDMLLTSTKLSCTLHAWVEKRWCLTRKTFVFQSIKTRSTQQAGVCQEKT